MTYIFFQDAGHGWLRVTRDELVSLGIADKISDFSYQSTKYVYLEEDCDAYLFTKVKNAINEAFKVISKWTKHSSIRNKEYYKKPLDK